MILTLLNTIDICGTAPDMHQRFLSTFGTDKQMFPHSIRAIFPERATSRVLRINAPQGQEVLTI